MAQDLLIALAGFSHSHGAGLAHAHAVAKTSAAKDRVAVLELHDEQRTAQPAEGLADAQLAADGFAAGRAHRAYRECAP